MSVNIGSKITVRLKIGRYFKNNLQNKTKLPDPFLYWVLLNSIVVILRPTRQKATSGTLENPSDRQAGIKIVGSFQHGKRHFSELWKVYDREWHGKCLYSLVLLLPVLDNLGHTILKGVHYRTR